MASQHRPIDWLLLAALLFTATTIMVTQNAPLLRTLRAETMEWTAQVESTFAWMGHYLRVLERNDELRRENIRLSSQVARTRATWLDSRMFSRRSSSLRSSTRR